MNKYLVSLFIMFGILSCTTQPTRDEKDARNRKTLEQIKQQEKEDNLSPSEKKVHYQLIWEIRNYEKQLKLGKNEKESSANIRELWKKHIDDNDRLNLIVRLKPKSDSMGTAVKLIIEKVGGVVHRFGSWNRMKMCIDCSLPIGKIREISDLEDVEAILHPSIFNSGE